MIFWYADMPKILKYIETNSVFLDYSEYGKQVFNGF